MRSENANTSNNKMCQVTSVPLRSELFVAPAATPPTSRKPSLDPTQPPRAEAQEDKRRKVIEIMVNGFFGRQKNGDLRC